jgi:REP element-mobilizing transposase RayT
MPHALISNLVHAVFSAKNRVDSIPEPTALWRYLGGVAKAKHIPLIIAGGTKNHAHLLIALPAVIALSRAVQDLKGNSSRWLNQQQSGFAWQEGYSAFSVSPTKKRSVVRYIANQEEHHRRSSFEQELTEILKKSGIEYDSRFVFG